jgi:hypothetical protein
MDSRLEKRLQALEDREMIKEAVALYSLYILNNEASKIPDLAPSLREPRCEG